MRHSHHRARRISAGAGALAGALLLGASALGTSALAAGGPVGTTPAAGTPQLVTGTKPPDAIYQIAQCGSKMYAVGKFTTITQNGTNLTRDYAFSFSAAKPYTVTSWAPGVNGPVNTIAFNGSHCADAYIGGDFTKIGGTTVRDVAEVSTKTGAVVSGFGHTANRPVSTMVATHGHLLTGGYFTKINGSSADPYYTSLNLTTGKDDGYLKLHVSGHYIYTGVKDNPTRISAQQLSHDGTRMLVEGDFTSVGGQARQQAFQLQLGSASGQVNGWNAPLFNTHCNDNHPQYVTDGAWGAGDTDVYFSTSGYHVLNWDHTFPMPPPCDMALAFSASAATQSPAWINPTGCYSLFSVAADSGAVYFAGHQRYTQNPNGCKHKGPKAINDSGLEGVNPATGKVLLNAAGKTMYSMSRANAGFMLVTSAGLWIASSNRFNSNACDGVNGHSGICFLPY